MAAPLAHGPIHSTCKPRHDGGTDKRQSAGRVFAVSSALAVPATANGHANNSAAQAMTRTAPAAQDIQ
ncbi:hypothetical protein [Reyranella sp. CPCC 100927]|uniref:hypothetical protein n=1 Tax=Reyranella sp. CPCC 100927 TaxID=2599616 RepID=UPI0011B85D69|nr:hypothetical protein [Reyranella sp. CPCC 100927]TWT11841.1 hypothetical protein FQU96_15345 [Reyranella sp. CPCC 100927]